jgi:CRISPR-associated endonuclease/helicase Cas3
VDVTTLGKLLRADKKAVVSRIAYCRVLLPPAAGGLTDKGTLDGLLAFDPNHKTGYDIADKWFADKEETIHRRVRSRNDDPKPAPPDGMRLIRTLDTKPDADECEDESETTGRRFWHWYELPQSADNEGSKTARKAVRLDVHAGDVERRATEIVRQLPLSDDHRQAVIVAARFHDLGKRRPLFQRILGNHNPDIVLAKSATPSGLKENYRHEFGSLLDIEKEAEFRRLNSDMQDLVLHLIAAHHGRGRPHFPTDELDPERDEGTVSTLSWEVPRRFARLQRKYGRWGLAYLESLLRAADYVASANPTATVGGQP